MEKHEDMNRAGADSRIEKQRKKIQRMKRIMAWAGIIILALLYIAVFVIGLAGKAGTQDLLMVCIIGTVLVPVTMYAMIRLTDTLAGKHIIGEDREEPDDRS